MIGWGERLGIIIACCFVAWLLMGCSDLGLGDGKEERKKKLNEDRSVEELYNEAADTMAAGKYKDAVEQFEEVERQHPYSDWAKKAQVMAGYSAYRANQYDDAALILERFAKIYPNNESTPYAYYLRALCYYDQITDVGRDQKRTQEAQQALKDVISRFPNTNYARDAKLKLDLTQDHLAGKEMEVGRYYLVRDEYLSAINRFNYVVKHFQTTSHIPEALHRLVEAYLRLGVKAEAKKYAAVLGYNYPGSEWYEFSYKMMKGDVNPEDAKTEGWLDEVF